jgi:hypothetical protein
MCLIPLLLLGTQPVLTFADSVTVGDYVDITNSEADTAVFLQADNTKLLVSVPSEVHVKVNGDGTFITPIASAAALKNLSVFSIHVSSIASQFISPFIASTDSSVTSDTTNIVTYKIGVDDGDTTSSDGMFSSNADVVTLGDTVTPSGWTLTKEGTDGASLPVKQEGNINNISNDLDLSIDQEFMSIHWVFAAGSGDNKEPVTIQSTLEAYSWDDLKTIADDISVNGEDSQYYTDMVELMNSQSAKTINIGTVDGNSSTSAAETIDVQIIGINHDTKSDGTKAGLTLQITAGTESVLTHAMNATNTNVGGWASSDMRTWLNSSVATALTNAGISLATVTKYTDNEGYLDPNSSKTSTATVTTDSVFLLSPIEVWGTSFIDSWNSRFSSYTAHYYASEGSQYELYSSLGVTASNYSSISSSSWWWLRSPSVRVSGYFLDVFSSGGWDVDFDAGYAGAVRAAFCL